MRTLSVPRSYMGDRHPAHAGDGRDRTGDSRAVPEPCASWCCFTIRRSRDCDPSHCPISPHPAAPILLHLDITPAASVTFPLHWAHSPLLLFYTHDARAPVFWIRDATFRKMTNQNQTDTNEIVTTETKNQTDFYPAGKYQYLNKF